MIVWFPGYGFGYFMQIAFLYALTAWIWGSTWLAITFQLGTVDPEISVVYRFALASRNFDCVQPSSQAANALHSP